MEKEKNKLPLVLKFTFLSFLFFVSGQQAFSQDNSVDSLTSILKTAKHDTTRCNTLVTISETLYYSIPDTVIPLSLKIIEIADKNFKSVNNKEQRAFLIAKASALNNIALMKGSAGDFQGEIEYNLKSLAIQEQIKNRVGLAASLNNLSIAYTNIGDINKGLDYQLRGLKVQEEINDSVGQATSLNNLGYIFNGQKDPKKALEYYEKSLKISRSLKDKIGEARTIGNIANVYEKFGRPDCKLDKSTCITEGQKTALDLYQESYKLHEEVDNKLGMAYMLNNIAISYKNLGDPNAKGSKVERIREGEILALRYFGKSLEIHKSAHNKSGIGYVTNNMASLFLKQGNIKKAREFAESSLLIAKEVGHPELIKRAAGTLKNIYKAQNKYADALEMYELEVKMADSIANEENRRASFQKNIQYSYEKKAAADSIKVSEERKLNTLKLEKEVETKRNLMVTVFLIALIVIVLAVLLILLIRNVKERKSAYGELLNKNVEIQNKTEILVSQSRQIAKYQSQMNPHFIFNALNSIQGFVVNNEKDKTLTQLQSFSKLMRQTLSNSDNETISLKKELDYLHLYVNFERERFTNKFGFYVDADLNTDEIELPPMLIQPFIENALKHAGLNDIKDATVSLSIREEGDFLKVLIRDNGIGISKGKLEVFQNAHAVSIVQSRMKLLYEGLGQIYKEEYFQILSVPEIESGTLVELTLPLICKF